MSNQLIVIQPFASYGKGDLITDPDAVTAILSDGRAANVVKVSGTGSPSSTPVPTLSAASLGILPNTGLDLSNQIEAAQQLARTLGVPVDYLPGKYIYKRRLNNLGGGVTCTTGEAWFDNQDPAYTSVLWDFSAPDSSYLDGILIQGARWTCSTRPDSGLSNDASEYAGFINITNARNVRVWGNKFEHNYGGALLLRNVEDSSVIGNVATDMWKDVFHITGTSRNIVRAYNVVRGCGDDAFAVVGYRSATITNNFPVGITDLVNRVYGVRKARAFAYVGCQDVENIGCFVDGRIPSIIPQQGLAAGGHYNTACALYIASENGWGGLGTHGCENVKVRGFVAENIAPGVDNTGAPFLNLNQIHVGSGNGANGPIKNIRIEAILRNGGSRGLFVGGGGYTQDIEADLIVDDNTDPLGLASLTLTAGTIATNAAEFQNARNIKLKLRANKIGNGAVYLDGACAGYADLDVSVGSLCLKTIGQNVIHLAGSSALDIVDFKLNFEVVPPASGAGQIGNLIYNPNFGITRSTRITGVDHGTNVNNGLWGWNARPVTLGSSPTQIANVTGRQQMIQLIQGTVSAIARASVYGRARANSVTTGSGGSVVVEGDVTDQYTNTKVVTFFNARGVALGTGTCSGSSYAAGTNLTTVNFAGSTVNASFAAGMQMGILSTFKTLTGRTSGIVDLPPEMVTQITYTVAPSTGVTECSF